MSDKEEGKQGGQQQQEGQQLSEADLWDAAAKERAKSGEQGDGQGDAGAQQAAGDGGDGGDGGEQHQGGEGGAGEDPLAGLPEQTRKYFEALSSKIEEQDKRMQAQSQQLARANGTIGNLKQRLDASQSALQKITPTVDAVAAENAAKEVAKKAEVEARMKELREQFSEIPGLNEYLDLIMGGSADEKPAAADKGQAKDGGKADQQQAAAGSGEQQRTEAGAQADADEPSEADVLRLQIGLTKVHPDWMEVAESPEFKAWVKTQNAEIKAKAVSWDVTDAASVFTAFKKEKADAAEVARVEAERQERLRRGEGVQGRGSASGGADQSSDDALWNRAKREREKARATT